MYGPKRPFLLMYVSRDMRRIDFPQVDRLSTNPREMGRHTNSDGHFLYILPLGLNHSAQ